MAKLRYFGKEICYDETKIDINTNFVVYKIIFNDLNKFTNEAEKLALYTRHISLKDVELLVSRPEDANAFAIFDNLIHGNNKEEAKKDEEGLQTMRTLGKNMAWILKCIEKGKENGVQYPEKEKRISTNFIR